MAVFLSITIIMKLFITHNGSNNATYFHDEQVCIIDAYDTRVDDHDQIITILNEDDQRISSFGFYKELSDGVYQLNEFAFRTISRDFGLS